MKIIFLDIDGVLNNQLFYEEKSQQERFEEVGRPLCDIDPKCVKLLDKLCYETEAKVVISSTWRLGRYKQYFTDIFNNMNAEYVEVLGLTPSIYSNDYRIPRGVEIDNWLKQHTDLQISSYVILDDDSDMLYWQRNNMIIVDGYVGLTPTVCYKAKRILLEQICDISL